MNKQVSFDINCKNGLISPNNGNSVTLTIEDCDRDDLIEIAKDCTSIGEIIDSIGESEVLEHIGVDSVKKHFGLTEIE